MRAQLWQKQALYLPIHYSRSVCAFQLVVPSPVFPTVPNTAYAVLQPRALFSSALRIPRYEISMHLWNSHALQNRVKGKGQACPLSNLWADCPPILCPEHTNSFPRRLPSAIARRYSYLYRQSPTY